jgi:glycosyltransferase involved in cell wall biosynthesis
MRILLSNKYYYPRGGDCIYTIELEKLLIEKGHQVAVFSMQHPSNLNSPYAKYFPSEIDFNKKSFNNLVTTILRPFGSIEVHKAFILLIEDFRPDVIHLNNIHTQISPIIARIAHDRKIPVIWTLHDGKLVCPAYLFLSNNEVCEACLDNRWNVIKKRCIKNSFPASILAFFESVFWNRKKLSRLTNVFISPSIFLKGKMVLGGLNPAKVKVVNNFLNISKFSLPINDKKDYYCYIGRLSSEKGIETLLKAAALLPEYSLKLIGTGPLEDDLKSKNNHTHIEFLGYKNWDELKLILMNSRCMVIPSECYENNPLTVLESLCMGTPVIGSRIGGIPELINPDNGLLFEPKNSVDLQNKISFLWNHPEKFDSSTIANNARKQFNSDTHYKEIIGIYNTCVNRMNN